MIGNSRILRSFYIDGESSGDYGLLITGEAVWNAAAYDYEFVEIPGRSGDLILDNGRFRNITITYPCALHNLGRMQSVRSWLSSKRGYHRITDDYNPGEYRLGVVVDGISVDPFKAQSGTFTVTFNCKPQRFIESEPIRYAAVYTDGADYYGADVIVDGTLFNEGETILKDYNSTSGNLFPDLVSVRYAAGVVGDYTTRSRAQLTSYMSWAEDHAELDLSAALAAVKSGGAISIVTSAEPNIVISTRSDPTLEWKNTTLSASGTIENATPYESSPLIEMSISAGGLTVPAPPSVTIGEITASTIAGFEGQLYIDSDVQDAYLIDSLGRVNANDNVVLDKGGELTTEFPTLQPGENLISLVSATTISGIGRVGYCSIEINPRFFLI